MTDEERKEWADQREAELHDAANEAAQLSDDEQAALDALSESSDKRTAVTLRGGDEVEVKTYLNARMEDNFQEITENRDDLSRIRSVLVESLSWIIETEPYDSERLWRVYADEYGTMSLAEEFFVCVEPVMDSIEDAEVAQRFRTDK
jgi:hypothetical protein